MHYWCLAAMASALLVGACGGSSATPERSSPSVRDQRDAAGQAYLRLAVEATAQWKASAAVACNRRATNEETWPIMAEYFAVQASIDQRFVRGIQQIKFPADVQADAATAITAFGVRADDFTKLGDQERAHESPDFTAIQKDGVAAVAASRKLRADLGLPLNIQPMSSPCDLSG